MSNVPKPRVFQVRPRWVDTYEYPVGVLKTVTYPAMWNWHCDCKEKQRDRSMCFDEALKGANEHSRMHTAERLADYLDRLTEDRGKKFLAEFDRYGSNLKSSYWSGEAYALGNAAFLVRQKLVEGKTR